MKPRFAVLVAVVALFAAAVPAAATPPPGVHGGGFLRGSDKSKTTLTIAGFDEGILDRGQATVVRHTPGSAAAPSHITISCVTVVGSLAVASGFGSDGQMYLIAVRDGGEGRNAMDAFAVVSTLGAPVYCLGGVVPTGVALGPITGGNFQVTPGP